MLVHFGGKIQKLKPLFSPFKGMRASVHVDLPGWTKEGNGGMEPLKKRCEELKVQPRGTRGESGGQTGQ